MHVEIKKGKDYTFVWKIWDYAIQQVPTSPKISIYDNGGTAVVSAASGVVATDGTVSYTFLAAANDECGKNFKAVLTYDIGSDESEIPKLFDVVEFPLVNNFRDEDLYKYLPELRSNVMESTCETTTAGTTTTLISKNLEIESRVLTGGRINISISNDTIHEAKITVFDKATGKITFTPAYSIAIASGLFVRLRTCYQDQIDLAFDDHVHRDIRNQVSLAAGYIDADVVKNLVVFKALEIICTGKVEIEKDKWDLRSIKYADWYKAEMTKLNEPFDLDEDGNISDTEDDEKPDMISTEIYR